MFFTTFAFWLNNSEIIIAHIIYHNSKRFKNVIGAPII